MRHRCVVESGVCIGNPVGALTWLLVPVPPSNQGCLFRNSMIPQCMNERMTRLWHRSRKFLALLNRCGGLDVVNSAAAGLRLATTPNVMAMKSRVDLCRISAMNKAIIHLANKMFECCFGGA